MVRPVTAMLCDEMRVRFSCCAACATRSAATELATWDTISLATKRVSPGGVAQGGEDDGVVQGGGGGGRRWASARSSQPGDRHRSGGSAANSGQQLLRGRIVNNFTRSGQAR